jgi:acetyl-CoA C-acetyltransferase
MATKKFADAMILSAVRTPIGAFGGSLSSLAGPRLGAVAIQHAVKRAGLEPNQIQECIMGNVVSANIGQAPARQSAIYAGLPVSTVCTTINKVCASGMKAVMYASQGIMLGQHQIIVAGGFESMSNVPYYLEKGRNGYKYGHGQVVDGIIKDGLWDPYDNHHMGNAGEHCAKELSFSREDQDKFAIESYRRAQEAAAKGYFKNEIVPVPVASKKGEVLVEQDEELLKVDFSKIPGLRPAFDPKGTITAANASSLNDGASALVLASSETVSSLKLKPIARIVAFADAEGRPIDFTTAPAAAIPKALKMAGLKVSDIDFFEINEAFSVVVLANIKLLELDPSKVNVNGGAVSIGHPIGMSGARLITHMAHLLHQRGGRYACAAICNGGGGASAVIIERV